MELSELCVKLDALQASKNDGRGVSCVRSLVAYLSFGNLRSARNVWNNENDKISSYPDIQKFLNDELAPMIRTFRTVINSLSFSNPQSAFPVRKSGAYDHCCGTSPRSVRDNT